MKTSSLNLRTREGSPLEKGGQGNMVRNTSAYPHNISPILRKQHHFTIDLNKPAQIEQEDQYNSFVGLEESFEVGSTSKKIRKTSLTDSTVNEYESYSDALPILTLSLPELSSNNLPIAQKPTTSQTSLPSYLSSILDSDLGGTAKDELPSLVVTRCTFCYMFVMAFEADPKCPRCKNSCWLKFLVNHENYALEEKLNFILSFQTKKPLPRKSY